MKILVTGGAGFIGSNFVRWVFERDGASLGSHRIVVLDALTYAGNLANLDGLEGNYDYRFVRGDIRDADLVSKLFKDEKIDAVINFAAESHVDRSILDPLAFVRTNIEGTQVLLNAAREAEVERYLQISTDEVYGSLGPTGRFTESSPLKPSSAYSASKTGADLLALAGYHTHGMHTMVSRCSNNYGPFQFPEKLIPLFITNAMADKPLPLYGDGKNVRSWLHVDDHSRAIMLILQKGRAGEVYNIGGAPESEKENVDVTHAILHQLGKPETLIKPVEDRLGHDRRYAVDYSKIKAELGWEPQVAFEDGLESTVRWYQQNESWWQQIKSGEYETFYEAYYGDRLRA
ncbi:MAG: dTDP-glucose 4,6-dehydratase [Bdellovibrionales bacterium]|nr:dTDP-glucose 4,6-dehydratase [Bdellovibrionales bacterium]